MTSGPCVLCVLGGEGVSLSHSCPSAARIRGGSRGEGWQTQALFWQKLPFCEQVFPHSRYPPWRLRRPQHRGTSSTGTPP